MQYERVSTNVTNNRTRSIGFSFPSWFSGSVVCRQTSSRKGTYAMACVSKWPLVVFASDENYGDLKNCTTRHLSIVRCLVRNSTAAYAHDPMQYIRVRFSPRFSSAISFFAIEINYGFLNSHTATARAEDFSLSTVVTNRSETTHHSFRRSPRTIIWRPARHCTANYI